MTTVAPNHRFATGNMTSQFGNGSWKPDGSIWGSTGRNHIGSAFSGDLPSSRASDEASPTTVSGSAQLNHQSEAETPSWRNGIWNQEGSSQVHPSSGTASPSQTRSAVGQSSAFAGRPKNTNAFINGFGSTNDSLDNGPTFPPLGSRMFDGTSAYKRGSLGEFPVISQARKNSVPGQRSHDFSSQTTPGSLNHDLAQYPFEGVSRSSVSRPSVPHQSISFPTNGSLDQELSHLLSDSIRLNDNSPGNPNPTTQPFRFDPSSQAWNNGFAVNGRHFSQIYPQQDPYRDQTPAAYSQQAQGASLERASPSSHSFSRNGLSSPRYTPGTGPRQDSWSQSRPISRGPSMPQEYERQPTAQFSQPASGYYSGAPYYGNNNFSTQYSMPLQAYDIYGPNAGYRGQLAAAQFSMINQGASNSVRPNKDQDPGKGVRSVLLEEFRASNRSNKRWELKDIFGHVVEFSGDQHGSRFIQEKLQSANSDEKDQVFHEIKSNALQLMKDVFGNYVIQKFFEHGSQVQKTILAREMKGRVLELSVQMYACRVVQKALEHVLVEQQENIVEEIKPNMMTILKDNNGNHVVQKAIQVVPQESMPFLMDLFRGQVQGFATHAFGCRIIQRMLESGTVAEKEELMKEIYASTPTLITDQFGNYVAQHIIEKGDPKPKSYFIDYITAHLYEYSTHKFASNVVETCIKHGSAVERQTIINKLLTPEAGGGYLVDRIMLDQYGNYVIQHTVEKLRGEDKAHMVREIRLRFNDLKKSHTSRQMGAIERLLDKHEKLLNVEEAPAPPKANKRNPAELQLDVSSPSTTPALTMENSSPKSNNSASSDKGKDVSDMTIATGKMTIEPTTQLQVVTVDEDAN